MRSVVVISGKPDSFMAGADIEAIAGRYSNLEYDLDAGTVEFSEEAVITEGGNRISSSYLLYNIIEQRINAQSSGEGDEKVKITVIPESAEEQLPQGDDLP